MSGSATRRAFTLVELLVVTGLMAGLLGLVLTVGRPSGRSQVSQLLQLTSSAVLATQTRAIGREAGAALILEPGVTGSTCNAVFQADAPPFLQGSGSTGMPSEALAGNSYVISFGLRNGMPADLSQGYRIRFSGTAPSTPPSPWFRFASSGTTASGTVALRASSSQTLDNTGWPSCIVGVTGTSWLCEVAGFPRKGPSLVEPLKFAAIDLRFSGVGDTVAGDYGSLAAKGPIAICFNRNGRLDAVMQFGGGTTPFIQPLEPSSPLYLLIATLSDIQENRSLQSTASRWLVISPDTGRVSIAVNVAVTGTTEADIVASRSNARLGIAQGAAR
jgi:type II secretory pathway pseudopilin PulG